MLRAGVAQKLAWHATATPVTDFGKNFYTNNYQAFSQICNNSSKVGMGFDQDKEKQGKTDNLFVNTRGYLILGRIIGVIPISGVFTSTPDDFRFHILSFPAISSILICLLLLFSTSLAMVQTFHMPKLNALDIAQSIQGLVFILWGLLIYLYFLFRAKTFIRIFTTWGKSSLYFSIRDEKLKRDVALISSVVFISAICESLVLHLEYFPQFDSFNGMSKLNRTGEQVKKESTLAVYYSRAHVHWQEYLGYHPVLAVISFLQRVFTMSAWNYVDVLVIILSRAMYFKFRALCKVAEEKLRREEEAERGQGREGKTTYTLEERLGWVHIVKDHDTLCEILSSFEAFLSPLIFGSYATNVYYICMQLIDGLTPDKIERNIVYSIFAPLSFLHLLVRMFLLSIQAARIHTYAHELGSILKRCPIELYDSEVSRTDKHVTSGPDIGLTGMQCFTVTKPFLLSIINVVFTVEIVLLQGLSVDSVSSCPSPTSSS